jgi:hypothetical protein
VLHTLVLCLLAARLSHCTQTLRHRHNKLLNQLPRYATLALLQSLTKPILFLLSLAVVVVLWVQLEHASLKYLLEVFN